MHRAEEEVVAVARASGGVGRTDRTAGARQVLDDELLADRLAQVDRKRAAEGIDPAARRERVDHRDRLGRPLLRLHRHAGRGQRCGQQCAGDQLERSIHFSS
jgi:hypothetical protein